KTKSPVSLSCAAKMRQHSSGVTIGRVTTWISSANLPVESKFAQHLAGATMWAMINHAQFTLAVSPQRFDPAACVRGHSTHIRCKRRRGDLEEVALGLCGLGNRHRCRLRWGRLWTFQKARTGDRRAADPRYAFRRRS